MNEEIRNEEMNKILIIMRMNNVDAVYFTGLLVMVEYSDVV